VAENLRDFAVAPTIEHAEVNQTTCSLSSFKRKKLLEISDRKIAVI